MTLKQHIKKLKIKEEDKLLIARLGKNEIDTIWYNLDKYERHLLLLNLFTSSFFEDGKNIRKFHEYLKTRKEGI
jgi:hypothetical protein